MCVCVCVYSHTQTIVIIDFCVHLFMCAFIYLCTWVRRCVCVCVACVFLCHTRHPVVQDTVTMYEDKIKKYLFYFLSLSHWPPAQLYPSPLFLHPSCVYSSRLHSSSPSQASKLSCYCQAAAGPGWIYVRPVDGEMIASSVQV